uniref:Uncharacterized protein n=1 Tax=Caenorhabditis japonica TaxID=281687 RepID=A0A8R1E6Z5_CAEJA
MDLATRKRFHSTSLDAPGAKVPALAVQEQLTGFADIMTVHLLNAINVTEPAQRTLLLEDLIARIKWLKQQQQEVDSKSRKLSSPEKASHYQQAFDPKQMQVDIQKQIEMLNSMANVFRFTARLQNGQAFPAPPQTLIPPTRQLAPHTVAQQDKNDLPARKLIAPVTPPAAPQKTSTPTPTPLLKPATVPPPIIPTKQMVASAEEFMLEIQNKQRKLIDHIQLAHGGPVTDDLLNEYLKHPYIYMKENGELRAQPNPFFHMMAQPTSSASGSAVPLHMMAPTAIHVPVAVPQKSTVASKSTTPIPGPPVLIPQVELPMKKSPVLAVKKGSTSPSEKVSPPPQLPPQLTLQVPTPRHMTKMQVPFEIPATRSCNQWSVFSMALPLRLLCRCYSKPCTCQV